MHKYQTAIILITAPYLQLASLKKTNATNAENENLNYAGSKFHNNDIWGEAMNLAWNELI